MVTSDAQVATNKNSDSMQKIFPWGGWGRQCPDPFFKLLKLSETSRDRKFIFGMQVNIDKTNSRSHVTRGRWYIGGPVYYKR